jgi:cytochrome c biogenesis protein CcmG, thiol:disulfide interchange protein DsbE
VSRLLLRVALAVAAVAIVVTVVAALVDDRPPEPKPARAPSRQAASRALAGSPGALEALHAQAGALLGPVSALRRRLASLRGYPVVVNAWASWCPPCRMEFPLLASASARFGREVAFVGFDSDDQPGEARAFMKAHPISYPSYSGESTELSFLAPVEGLPTTFFLGANGKLAFVHAGQYETQRSLDADIERYALAGEGAAKRSAHATGGT